MLKKYSLKALEKALNQTLALDEETPQKIKCFEGKTLKINITPLDMAFYIQFAPSKIHLLETFESPPDTTIYSSPLGLIRLSLLPASKARSLFHDKIRITGDVALGQQVKKLFDELNIDWEGHLAQFTGDIVAHQVGTWVRQGMGFKNHMTQSMTYNVSEYLQEELRVCPSRQELDDFLHDIDKLRSDVDRLEALTHLMVKQRENH